jgi:hypothetical protein
VDRQDGLSAFASAWLIAATVSFMDYASSEPSQGLCSATTYCGAYSNLES